MLTQTIIEMGESDENAKKLAVIEAQSLTLPFSDFISPVSNDTSNVKYATLENNYCILDGSMVEFPENEMPKRPGIWSSDISNVSGAFPSNVLLSILFHPGVAQIEALTLYTNAKNVDIICYGSNGETAKSFIIDDDEFAAVISGIDVTKITMRFSTTRDPQRYLRFYGIKFGFVYTITDLISCKQIEEISLVSEYLCGTVCDFAFYDKKGRFNVADDKSALSSIKRGTPVKVKRINQWGQNVGKGVFYLEEWSNPDNTERILSCSAGDKIHQLLNYTEYDATIYANETVKSFLDRTIPFPIDIDDNYKNLNIPSNVALPFLNLHSLLLWLSFALGGAYVSTGPFGVILIKSLDMGTYIYTIPEGEKLLNSKVKRNLVPKGAEIQITERKSPVDDIWKVIYHGLPSVTDWARPWKSVKRVEYAYQYDFGGSLEWKFEKSLIRFKWLGHGFEKIAVQTYSLSKEIASLEFQPSLTENTDEIISFDSPFVTRENSHALLSHLEYCYNHNIEYQFTHMNENKDMFTRVGLHIKTKVQGIEIIGYVIKREVDLIDGYRATVTMLGKPTNL